jgi:hypothetical protein
LSRGGILQSLTIDLSQLAPFIDSSDRLVSHQRAAHLLCALTDLLNVLDYHLVKDC